MAAATARPLWRSGKLMAGWLLARSGLPQFDYANAIFILAHMRCGSTALSNVLCSRPDISGYGEAHVRHDGAGALGRLALNQLRRGAYRPRARHLFDKILHSRHDADPPPQFWRARAIFMLREPEPAIRSIVALYQKLGRAEYDCFPKAATYYAERVGRLCQHWDCFAPEQRIGLTHGALLRQPDRALALISARLHIDPPLANHYVSPPASRLSGAGDPTESSQRNRIEPALLRPPGPLAALALPESLEQQVRAAHAAMLERIAADTPELAS